MSDKVHPHRGHKVHPAHTVRGVDHHKKMNHYPSANPGGGHSTAEPMTPGAEVPGSGGLGGDMGSGMPDGDMDGDGM